jgi:hypothetical protein
VLLVVQVVEVVVQETVLVLQELLDKEIVVQMQAVLVVAAAEHLKLDQELLVEMDYLHIAVGVQQLALEKT